MQFRQETLNHCRERSPMQLQGINIPSHGLLSEVENGWREEQRRIGRMSPGKVSLHTRMIAKNALQMKTQTKENMQSPCIILTYRLKHISKTYNVQNQIFDSDREQ